MNDTNGQPVTGSVQELEKALGGESAEAVPAEPELTTADVDALEEAHSKEDKVAEAKVAQQIEAMKPRQDQSTPIDQQVEEADDGDSKDGEEILQVKRKNMSIPV